MPSCDSLVRPHIRLLTPYIPGEQPEERSLIKLNTNENPYGPSPKVLNAVRNAVSEQLRLYPSSTAESLRRKLASFHGLSINQIIVGNGSDELLALATRAFVKPVAKKTRKYSDRQVIQYFTPSYSLYRSLASIHAAQTNEVPLTKSFGIPALTRLQQAGWRPDAALSFVTTPNAPSGRPYRTAALRRLCAATRGAIILDEAYVDFAEENALSLPAEFSHVIVSRTFSKAYSLCFQRIGYFVGPEPLIAALHKIRDSYNVNGLAQIAALATLDDLPHYRKNFQTIVRERDKLARSLSQLGFQVTPSAANFLLVSPPRGSKTAAVWQKQLRQQGILVRWFPDPSVRHCLRITIGTPEQNQILCKTMRKILNSKTSSSVGEPTSLPRFRTATQPATAKAKRSGLQSSFPRSNIHSLVSA